MAHRDYKQTGPRRSARGKPGKDKGILKSLLIGLALSLIIAAVLLWFLWPQSKDFKEVASAPKLQPPAKSAPEPAKPVPKPAEPAQNYTFYDILPGNQAPRPQAANPQKMQWWLQVAALKSGSDADTLRAKLSLLNFNAVVQPTPAGEPLLYRVRVGPYPDQASAATAQQTLAENKIESRALKEAVTP